jgi:hypothetical protein
MPPGGSSTVHIYTQTIDRTTQNKKYTEQHKNISDTLLYSYADTDKSRRNCQDFLNLRFRQSNSRLETVTVYKIYLLKQRKFM